MYKASELFGYGVLQGPQARSWEERLQVFLYTGQDLPDDQETFEDEDGIELCLTTLMKWKTDRLAIDSELWKSVSPLLRRRIAGLVALVGEDFRGLLILTVMVMAAGAPLPGSLKDALPRALDWAVKDADAQEDGEYVWPEPDKRRLILTAFQNRIRLYDEAPVYVGGTNIVQAP